jgi:hypothetical protein
MSFGFCTLTLGSSRIVSFQCSCRRRELELQKDAERILPYSSRSRGGYINGTLWNWMQVTLQTLQRRTMRLGKLL